MSAVWHGAEIQHLCVTCHRTDNDILMDTGRSNWVVTETMETQKKVKNCKKLLQT